MKIVEVPAEALQAVINYLSRQPYADVAPLLVALAPTGKLDVIDKGDEISPPAV